MQRLIAVVCLSLFCGVASSHSGGLNSQGCHTNRKTGEYHCHREPTRAANGPAVKKSRSGICHDHNSRWYDQTIHFEAFATLNACLESGGRLPKS